MALAPETLILLPIVSAALVSGLPERRAARVSVAFGIAAVAVALLLLLHPPAGPQALFSGAAWASFHADPLAGVLGFFVAAIALVVRVYALRYMAEEPGYTRFFALTDLLVAAIFTLILAADLITLLLAWYLVGSLLAVLVGHDHQRAAARRYALWTYLTARLGDLPLWLAAVLLYQAFGTLSLPALFEAVAAAPDTPTAYGLPLADTVALLVALAAFARSAQFPLHAWLAYSMDGPTPVSALMHAGIVNAGGFLLNRFAPVFVDAGGVLHLVFAVGLVTALMGSVLMLAQNDVKKALGYSTMGQMGFMFVEIGVGAFSLAIYHLIAHGLFKGTLFLGAGGAIHAARRHDGVPHDPVYTLVVERRSAAARLPWLVAAAITVGVPLVVLIGARALLGDGFGTQQSALVLLFFGWVTGAQLLFATQRMRPESPARMLAMIVLSLVIVVAGYTLIEHAFDRLLYPDRELAAALRDAAAIPYPLFVALMGAVALAVVAGWLAALKRLAGDAVVPTRFSGARVALYSLVSREFYVNDLAARLGRGIDHAARRLNVWTRWL